MTSPSDNKEKQNKNEKFFFKKRQNQKDEK